MKICVIGGGNIGTAIAADLARKNQVTMLTGHPTNWKKELFSHDTDTGEGFQAILNDITDSAEKAVKDAQVVFLTVPSFLMEQEIRRCEPYLAPGKIFCVMPGTGGAEFLCRGLLEKGGILAGFDRVTHVSRLETYGKCVNVAKKKKVRIAALPKTEVVSVAALMSELFEMECTPLENYLTVTFTPSNPLLHTARVFDLFGDYKEGMTWPRNILFYGEWTNFASEVMLECDAELQALCRRIEAAQNINLQGVIPLKEHYGVETISELTDKMQSIKSLQNITSPMSLRGENYIPDFNSRYFLEDFPYGLCILRGFIEVAGLSAPYMDKILKWYCQITGKQYYFDGKFKGADLAETAIPQNYGITTLEELGIFYNQ